ncbi:hypothetical protein DFH09DRAFT_1271197 [Mycena vulgaris]|nr:hypothetical protein DFH09DRAFT_1271197 [Mycena vulgaris]
MGDIGLPIYGLKDKWTADLLKTVVVPDCRTAGAVAAPFQLTTDKGSETGWQYAIQTAIREAFAPDIDPAVYPSAAFLKSIHNTVIETFWRWLRENGVSTSGNIFFVARTNRFMLQRLPFIAHQGSVQLDLPPIIQSLLDEFRTHWNQHTIRAQPEKEMPSGHAPADAFEHPGLFGGLDCGIQVPKKLFRSFAMR